MRRSESIGLLTLTLIGVVGLGLGRHVAEEVETRTRTETRAKLDSLGFQDVAATVDGSIVALSGSVRSTTERDVILENLHGLEAAPEVVDNLVVVASFVDLQPSILQIQKDGGVFTLSGAAPNAEARDLLNERAEIGAVGAAVINVMETQSRRAEDDWMRAAEASIDAVSSLRVGRASVEPGVVRVSGAAADAERKAEIEAALRAAIDDDFRLEIDIASPPPFLSPYVFAARKSSTGFEILTCAAPDAAQRSAILGALRARGLLAGGPSADLCVIANGAPNDAWAEAVERAIDALGPLVEGEIRIVDDRVELIGYVSEGADVARARSVAEARWPHGYLTEVDVREVLPVVTPFTLTAVKRPGDTRLSGYAPSRERSEAWAEILDATNTLELARGAPAGWAEAATIVIEALSEQKVGAVSLADRTIRLSAPGDQSERDRLEQRLRSRLPSGYRLTVVEAAAPERMEEQPGDATIDEGPLDASRYIFQAQRLPNGAVIVRGVVGNETSESVIGVYAKAQLGGSNLDATLVLGDGAAPERWERAIFAGLEALGDVESGELTVEPEAIFLIGRSQGAADARRAGAVLAEKSPEGYARFSRIEIVETRPKTEDELAGPTLSPQECVDALNAAVQEDPIQFASGSTEVSGDSVQVLDELGAILLRCPSARVEIGGHTDSLGSQEVNARLSRERAESVWGALVGRRVARDRLTAQGYGPSEPVASNETEEGRRRNRRIEFKLLGSAD